MKNIWFFHIPKRDFRIIYFYELKLGRISAETARNISELCDQGVTYECTVQHRLKKFRAGNTTLEDELHGSRPQSPDNDLLKESVEAEPSKTTGATAEKLNVDHIADYDFNDRNSVLFFEQRKSR